MNADIQWPFLLAGIVIALFGWVLYWTGIRVVGAFLGAGAGLTAALLLGAHFSLSSDGLLILCILAIGVGGALGLFLIRLLQFYFFFFLGAAIGAPIGLSLLTLPPLAGQNWAGSPLAALLAPLVVGIICGFAVLRGRRYIVAICSAVIGSALIALGLPGGNAVFIAVPCFITSVVVQTGLIRSFLPEDRLDRLIPGRDERQS